MDSRCNAVSVLQREMIQRTIDSGYKIGMISLEENGNMYYDMEATFLQSVEAYPEGAFIGGPIVMINPYTNLGLSTLELVQGKKGDRVYNVPKKFYNKSKW